MPSSHHSVSDWIASLKAQEAEAAQRLWKRYADELLKHARNCLGNIPRGMVDEEDIAQSVFQCVCLGAAAGKFENIKNRDELWWLLWSITKRKTASHQRREMARKRGGGKTRTEGDIGANALGEAFSLDWLIGDEPTPDFLVMLEEQNKRLLGLLRNDELRRIAISRIEGYSVPEIAAKLSKSVRSVERKLGLIRETWSEDLANAK